MISPNDSGPSHRDVPGRFAGIRRDFTRKDVERLRGSAQIRHTLAEMGADRLWHLLHTEDFVNSLGALTGNQAVQMVKAGLKAIYLSGWQVAADNNLAGHMYPDQSPDLLTYPHVHLSAFRPSGSADPPRAGDAGVPSML